MDYENFFEAIFAIVRNSSNAMFLLAACSVTLVTQIVKKAFIPKLKIDLLHRFDPTALLPFLLGICIAFALRLFLHTQAISAEMCYGASVEGITIGATATAIYHALATLLKSDKKLTKSDVYAAIYSQLMLFSDAKQKMLEKRLSYAEFTAQVTLLVDKSESIYRGAGSLVEKKAALAGLLNGMVEENNRMTVCDQLHSLLSRLYETKTQE